MLSCLGAVLKVYKNYQFLLKMKEEIPEITDYENKVLTMFSLEILNGKRRHELILIDLLLDNEKVNYEDYIHHLTGRYKRIATSIFNYLKSY